MKNTFQKIGLGLAALLIVVDSFLLGSILLPTPVASVDNTVGATIPVVPALFTSTLQASISTSDTSMTLTSGTDKSGDALSGTICYIIDEGTTAEEFVCGATTGTAVTSMTRGLDPVDGDTEVTALKKAHRRGATVKVTDYPAIGIISRILNGNETIPNVLSYAPGIATSTMTNSAYNVIDYRTAQALQAAGAANASETLNGLVELATQAECAAGTSVGGTGARLSCPNTYFNATQSSTTTVPVTGATGKLASGFIDTTASYSWSGAATFSAGLTSSATTTISGPLSLTGAVTIATSSLPVVRVYTTSSTWTKPANLRYITVEVIGGGGGGGGNTTATKGSGGGGGGGYAMEMLATASLGATETYIVGTGGVAGTGAGGAGGAGVTSSFGTSPFLQATGGGGGGADAGADRSVGGAGGVGSNGTLNVKGGPGGGSSAVYQPGGPGGSTVLGGGGESNPATGDGLTGGAYGGGGSGAYSDGADRAGGVGAAGVVIVTEYFL